MLFLNIYITLFYHTTKPYQSHVNLPLLPRPAVTIQPCLAGCSGVFARFANHPYRDKGNPGLSAEIDKLYSRYYCKYYGKDTKAGAEYSEEQAIQRAQIAEKYGFSDIRHAMFYRTRTFSAKEYIQLLGTYSDHIAIEEKIRTEFFAKIEETINQYGGKFTLYDTIDLQLARKP